MPAKLDQIGESWGLVLELRKNSSGFCGFLSWGRIFNQLISARLRRALRSPHKRQNHGSEMRWCTEIYWNKIFKQSTMETTSRSLISRVTGMFHVQHGRNNFRQSNPMWVVTAVKAWSTEDVGSPCEIFDLVDSVADGHASCETGMNSANLPVAARLLVRRSSMPAV